MPVMERLDPSEVIEQRMAALPLNKTEIYERSGLSDVKFRQIQRGDLDGVKRSTFNKMARALGWTPESLIALFTDGTEPEPFIELDPQEIASRLDQIQEDIAKILRYIAEDLAQGSPRDHSDD